MRIEVLKRYTPHDIRIEIERLAAAYSSIESLAHKISIGKCSAPDLIDDLMLWQSLVLQGVEVEQRVLFEGSDAVAKLSPKRLELLELIKKQDVASVTQLATVAKRNYKNVYDDLRALEECGLVHLEPRGRKLLPKGAADELRIVIER
ncbi:MAG: ArsR family transcriptional regulator [Candidatus Thermoplasmatota archaeon]